MSCCTKLWGRDGWSFYTPNPKRCRPDDHHSSTLSAWGVLLCYPASSCAVSISFPSGYRCHLLSRCRLVFCPCWTNLKLCRIRPVKFARFRAFACKVAVSAKNEAVERTQRQSSPNRNWMHWVSQWKVKLVSRFERRAGVYPCLSFKLSNLEPDQMPSLSQRWSFQDKSGHLNCSFDIMFEIVSNVTHIIMLNRCSKTWGFPNIHFHISNMHFNTSTA